MRQARLRISSDAPGNSVEIPLNGTGGDAPVGPAGPTGPAGATTAVVSAAPAALERERLIDAFAADRHRAKRARRLRPRYVSAAAAKVTIEVCRGRRVLTRVKRTAVTGANALVVKAPRTRGRYTLTLTAVAGNTRATDRARLTVT